jgi:hypothetical protein
METILSQNVLVLNRLWQAVNICSVKRAFMLLYQGHAQVVDAGAGEGSFQTMTFDQWFDFSRGYEGTDVSPSRSACPRSFCCSSSIACRRRR